MTRIGFILVCKLPQLTTYSCNLGKFSFMATFLPAKYGCNRIRSSKDISIYEFWAFFSGKMYYCPKKNWAQFFFSLSISFLKIYNNCFQPKICTALKLGPHYKFYLYMPVSNRHFSGHYSSSD